MRGVASHFPIGFGIYGWDLPKSDGGVPNGINDVAEIDQRGPRLSRWILTSRNRR